MTLDLHFLLSNQVAHNTGKLQVMYIIYHFKTQVKPTLSTNDQAIIIMNQILLIGMCKTDILCTIPHLFGL